MPEAASAVYPPPGRLRRLDGRVKLLLLLGGCLLSQSLPPHLLPLWALLQLLCFTSREVRSAGPLAMLRGSLWFIVFWLTVKSGTDILWGGEWQAAVMAAVPEAVRLFSLTLSGIIFFGISPPAETGRAAAWFLRPVLGRRAWKPALLVALTAWFLPLTLRLAGDVRAGMRARGLRLGWGKQAVLILGTSVRILGHKADELAVGLASRRLDDYRSWDQR